MQALMERFSLSEIQARSIVEMRLGQLTGLELDKLHQEYDEVTEKVRYYERILSDEDFLYSILIEECREIIDKYGDDRRSDIVYATPDMNPEDFYPDDDMIITISHYGTSSVRRWQSIARKIAAAPVPRVRGLRTRTSSSLSTARPITPTSSSSPTGAAATGSASSRSLRRHATPRVVRSRISSISRATTASPPS